MRVSECATAREQLICQVLTKFLPIRSLLYWLKTALRSTSCRDPLDAARDSEILGRRRQHIEIQFPDNPCDPGARFEFRTGPSRPLYSIDSEQLVRLVAEAGEELVGLCYFGDQPSRERIESQLAPKGSTSDS